jgi:ABC-type sugar transport system ATPase subunit
MTPAAHRAEAISADAITVRFGGIVALRDVSFAAAPGTVHALVGENGAGKSTLMKVLAGSVQPASGSLAVVGVTTTFRSPRDAHRAGVRMIQQELSLVPALSVAENILLGAEPSRYGVIDRRRLRERVRAVLSELGESIDPDTAVARLPLARRQLVEIAKALAHSEIPLRVLILDEPSAILSAHETTALLERLGVLKAQGVAIVYCSHRLDEIERVADEITVLRDGALVATGPARDYPRDRLIPLMVGRSVTQERVARPQSLAVAPPVLVVDHLSTSGSPCVVDASLTLAPGEIVGIVGLIGAGRSELVRAIFGAEPRADGTVQLGGADFRPRSPRDAVRAGVGFVPEDRKGSALVLHDPVRVNTTIVHLSTFAHAGVIDRVAERQATREWIGALRIKTPTTETPVSRLSGGNQQKVVLARWLIPPPRNSPLRVLIVDEPTRGVDVGARAEIYEVLRDLASKGTAILMVTSDLSEALLLADRLLVMRAGRIVGELSTDHTNPEQVASLMVPA